ncbi:MAG: TniB family NTP-binding protein [Xenococcaceae cyanobacterium MO_167.B52]|nr:TniB family NTP-binding protein [Xenococcaceae cyanobacterium MO_167.B52]
MTKGTVAEIRDRMLRVLKACGVEMLIIDEADRLKPKTFAEVRDIFDKLNIAVVLVGTDRLDTVIKRDEQVYNRFPALWVDGWCTRCFLSFVEMVNEQKSVKQM